MRLDHNTQTGTIFAQYETKNNLIVIVQIRTLLIDSVQKLSYPIPISQSTKSGCRRDMRLQPFPFRVGRYNYTVGPALTSALPASLPVYLAKFLTKRAARSLAFASHSPASA